MLKIVTQAHSFLSFWKKLSFIHTDLSMQKVLFEKVLLKKTFKKLTWFLLCTLSLFIDNIIKNKRGLKLVTSLSLCYKTKLEKFLL